ncbi:BA75_04987T0 [Komagataella pastoris]|uniref:pyridoxal kinase n=1 Tax=Komagataella pastoris TaxID=4922 RepID=A0A1B2JGZ0_PICPA|nr:BA75_04987T0 [Komagataella pastoris]
MDFETETATPRTLNCLSCSSQVVHGHVGNSAIQFPLQLNGWNVDTINTTQFSNHPGYGRFKGQKTSASEIEAIFSGLMKIGCRYDTLLLGYVADAGTLRTIGNLFANYSANHGARFVIDPVLGDNGKLYVSEDLIPAYKEIIKYGKVDMVTPNQFELEVLLGSKINSLEELRNAMFQFQKEFRVKNVVVTSVSFQTGPNYDDSNIYLAGLCEDQWFYEKVPEIDAIFSGSGDLFLSLLNHLYYHFPLQEALIKTASSVSKVLQLSYEMELDNPCKIFKLDKLYVPHLRMVEARDILVLSVPNK